MSQDPFEQFERSRGGLLIPVVLFVIGAVLTTAAVRAVDDVMVTIRAQVEPGEDPTADQVTADQVTADQVVEQGERETP